MSLYNALNGSSYTDPEELEFNTIDDVIYMGMKNDVSFLVMDAKTMNIWEHQSSVNPNLPVRFLMYAGQLYDRYMTEKNIYRYGTRLKKLPKPKCVCFYNGADKEPEEQTLKLSDAFEADDGDIEVRVRMLNINYGHSRALMEACVILGDYAGLIDSIRENQKAGMNLEGAVDTAIASMLDDSLLKRFLLVHKAEVKGMYLTEYDEEKERKLAQKEAREEGREEGLEEGRKKGLKEGLKEGRKKGLKEGLKEGRKEGLKEGLKEGRLEGQHEEKERVATDMLKKNFPLTIIEEISRLSEDAIRTIAANLGIAVI
ncbi:MAG: hypothetical protein IJR98_05265 [Synergistaceae bacterium]|nr:hypothetical protein [Synergistaceae bacterium]